MECRLGPGHAPRPAVAPGRAAAGPAGDHSPLYQPGAQHHQDPLAGRGHRLPRRGDGRQHRHEPDRPGHRVRDHHRGGLPGHQPADLAGIECLQPAQCLHHTLAGKDLPMSAVLRAPALPVAPPRVPLAQRLRASLFPDALSGLITATLLLAALWAGWKLLAWGLLDAETAANPNTCRAAAGACWGVVRDKYRLVFLGRYPMAEQWRPVAASLLLLGSVGVAALPRFFGRAGMAMLLAGLTGFGVLMAGGVAGLAPVPSDLWGGLPLTLFLAVIACLAGVPLGILLALGRRSSLPLIRILCTGFIEAVRGVPLITLLFFGAFVLPMLVPAQWRGDPIGRIAVCLAAFRPA